MQGDWGAAWDAIKSQFEDTINFIIGTLEASFDLMNALTFGKLGEMFDIFKFVFTAIWNTTIEIWDGIKNAIITPIEAARDVVMAVVDAIKGAIDSIPSIPDLTPGFDVPGIPLFHQGGIVPGIPGQAVPILAQAGEEIIPAGQVGGIGGGTTINITGMESDPNAIARAVSWELGTQYGLEGA